MRNNFPNFRTLIGALADFIPSAGMMVGVDVDMFAGVCIIAVVFADGVLKVVVSVKKTLDLRSVVMIDVFASTVIGVVFGTGVDVLADTDAKIWPAMMATLESILMPASSDEALFFDWEAYICCPTAVWNGALQTRMPSYHV